MERTNRVKLYAWLYSFKQFNVLKKYGFIHYSSRKMNYVVMYINQDKQDEIKEKLENLPFVREVSISPYKSVDMSFESSLENWMEKMRDKNSSQSNDMQLI